MDLLKQLESIREKYTDSIDAPVIEGWEKQVKQLLVTEHVAGSEAIKLLVESLHNEVKVIDDMLLNLDSKELPDALRDRMLDKKVLYLIVEEYFNVKGTRKALENQLNNA